MTSDMPVRAQQSCAGLQEAVLALDEQVSQAIAAIAEGNLDQLEQSLWQQQVLCASLQRSFREGTLEGEPLKAKTDLKKAAEHLLQTNGVYGQLIRQAERTSHALTQLCLEYGSDSHTGAARSSYSLEA